MLVIECSGTPYEIGLTHGTLASAAIHRTLLFYTSLFSTACGLSWPDVLSRATPFAQRAREAWPAYYEEMEGIAEGAGVGVLDVVALNVRTEIRFGMGGGCTALGWRVGGNEGEGDGEGRVWLAQNWDWDTAQKENLIITRITQPGLPTLIQVTEAGIIGKIGFNAAGVGTLFNALSIRGADPTRLPAHFGLRAVLESTSVAAALQRLEACGMASAAHILIGDAEGVLGVEFTKSTFARCEMDGDGRVVHTNHLLREHPGETDSVWLKDSPARMATMERNAGALGPGAGWDEIGGLFEDEEGAPGAICRTQTEETGSATLFNIVMDLKSKKAVVRLGRPTEPEEIVTLQL
ncbi:peptidase C45 acyl-coenzyme A:6-aminopenicillanic acid acyl-transferas-like protein [Boeremia exigua]|uniref:peptidase C45 acyl-coenzyme A:6-aminopenicillanic acid acyl-transferase-like protein n=1 Tax=Boeremia exigua TaxID=749465 RepID=UPI001E8CE13A|nr:peptidase C45 acyl-coenzyme A:6-aminopenicillanic acid acyl-transferase-like protein [Boeremia exigua]KAH6625618.1 peptidase C45 acyl-coenzyme A:6-aminopenicillanic acid acyl-transferas-like protein [Boeremia exigua]